MSTFGYVLGIKFLGPMSSGETITASWTGASGTVTTAVETAVSARTSSLQISTGATAVAQATNAYNSFVTDFSANFNFTGNSGTDTFYISSKNTTNPMSGFTTSSNVVFNYTSPAQVLPLTDEIRDRSSYLLISTGNSVTNNFSSTNFIIKQFEGNKNSFTTQPISYSITKEKVVNSQNNIWINLSNLAKEKLEGDVNKYLDTTVTASLPLSANESKWLSVEANNYYLDTIVSSGVTGYFIVDGFCEPEDNHQLPYILMSGKNRYIHRTSRERLYFKTDGLSGITYQSPSMPSPVTVTTIPYSGENQNYVQSVYVDVPLVDDRVTYSLVYPFNTEIVTYYIYDDCKFEKFDLVFKNKFGMLESIPMSKKSSKTLNVTGNDFIRSIVNYEGDFDITRHTSKQFNVTGTEEWMLNTDYLPEYMNAPIKQAMLTEEMWLIDEVGTIMPVVKSDQNITFKTSLNDKLIQYTLKVKLSHETVKNII